MRILLVLIAGLILFSGCVGNQPPGDTPASTPTNTINIKDFAFDPPTLTVKSGTTVTWTNQDSTPHTVTSDSGGEIASETLSKGQTYSHTFNTAGAFTYHCGVHPSMKGTIIVQ